MALAGDRNLLDRLVREHLPAALRFAMRLTGNPESAEEIVQEALYRAARGLHTFRGEAQFRTWFYRILLRAFHDSLAASSPCAGGVELTAELTDPRAVDPGAGVLAGELGELIARRISALPPRQREVLILTTYEQLTPREVAAVLGINEANVHVNLHHARARLRAELAPYLTEK